MYSYYTRKPANPELERLQRRSRYYPARPIMHPLRGTSTTPATTSRFLSSRMTQDTDFPKKNVTRTTTSLPPSQKVIRATDPLLPRMNPVRKLIPLSPHPIVISEVTSSPLLVRKGTSEGKNDISLHYHLVRIGLGIWELFKSTPPKPRFACVLLGIAVLILLSSVLNALLQMFALLANPLYIISGIIASVIVIYEFVIKK